jgi:hypothetical protein
VEDGHVYRAYLDRTIPSLEVLSQEVDTTASFLSMVMSKVASLGGLDLDETPFWTDMVALFHPTRRV